MIALLNETILWWHWVVFGIVLLILEMSSGTFIMLGLGVSAIFVGLLDSVMGTSFTTELSIWMILSILSIAAWFKWVKNPAVSHTGQSNSTLDTLGTVTEEIHPHDRGKVIFDTPVLGNTSWHATAKESITKETRIKIVEVNGQLIEVQKI
jgi:membrane protein implicated in regulation of membrane protease activity